MDSTDEIRSASPQAENGHVDIAHEIVEAFFKLQLSGNQWRVLWVIFRQTYGWHKRADRISISFFQRRTGLKRRHVSRAMKDLVERKIVTKNDTSFITTYGFQKDYCKWEMSPKKTLITKNDTKTVTKIGAHKRNSKETISLAFCPPPEEISGLYQKALPELPQISKWTPDRLKKLLAFQKRDPKRQEPDWWCKYFAAVRESSFLLGNGPRGWRANIDWLLKEANFIKVKEGHHADKARE